MGWLVFEGRGSPLDPSRSCVLEMNIGVGRRRLGDARGLTAIRGRARLHRAERHARPEEGNPSSGEHGPH